MRKIQEQKQQQQQQQQQQPLLQIQYRFFTSKFKMKKRYRRNAVMMKQPSSLNILLFSLFLILVVIPSLPLNHYTSNQHQLNLKSLIFAQATSTASTTSKTTAAATTTATTSNNTSNQTTSGRFVPLKRPVASYGQQQHQQFETAYACEGNRLDLSCRDEGKLIHVVRANYGRFSLSICNELGHSNLSTACASFRAFLPMQSRCNKQSNCTVYVSKELFGDPCESTPKYLEVQYYCEDVNSNGNNNQPGANSGLQTITALTSAAANNGVQQQNVADMASKTSQQPAQNSSSASPAIPVRINLGHKSQPSSTDSTAASNMASGIAIGGGSSGTSTEDFRSDFTGSNKQETTVIQQPNFADQFCAPQSSSRNLYWNYTRAGSTARQACPEGSSGKTSWFCDPEKLKFSPLWSPDFTQCKSTWLARLANQLDHMLEMPSKQQLSTEALKQQNEQILRVVLNDLALMARTKELFSEDLKRIDIMISQIITQIHSLSAVYGSASLSSWRSQSSSASFNVGETTSRSGSSSNIGPNSFNVLYEDLFNKLVNIVSSLFDVSQRSAWLDMQPNEYRRKLEQRFLNHLKDSGILLANSANQLGPIMEFRQANVFAAITVINNGLTATNTRFSPLNTNLMDLVDGNDFNLQLPFKLSNKFTTLEDNNPQMNYQLSEFKIHTSILRELVTNGITKLLVLDVRKPDYSLIKQQLESTYASTASSASGQVDGNMLDNNLIGEQQWTSKVFGVFAIVGENGDVLDGQQHANLQQQNKLTDLLAQWPISVDFKLLPFGSNQNPAVISTSTNQQTNQQASRQCNSLNSDNVNQQQQQNRCQTLTSNSTNHVCRCDQFGFVSLTTSPSNQQVPTSIFGEFNWPPMFGSGSSSNSQQQSPVDNEQRSPFDFQPDSTGANIGGKNVDLISSAPSYINSQNKQQASLGVWSTIFVVLGVSLLVVTFVAFLINFILKSSSQNRLNKKQAAFSASILQRATGGIGTGNDLNGLSTTGPIADHSLLGNIDPIVNHSPSQVGSSNHSTAASMLAGLSSQSGYHNYKAHQQLYTSHLPPIEVSCSNPVKRWTRWAALLKPSRWPPFSSVGKGVDQIIEHRVIGSTIGPGSVSYKSQYQNGYTTALHHSHQSTATSQVPLAAPSSSTSSYVSSSAYYEEIGPGNLTKINTSQLTNNNRSTHTIVDPFKRHIPPADQQQLLTANQQSHIRHQPWQTSSGPTTTVGATTTTTALSYSLDSQQQQQQQQSQQSYLNYGQPLSAIFKQQHNNNNDLNQVQSSSSSAASQHSASTSITTANGSTPRHYLFASPNAVNAYKSSMSQQTLHNHHHHQHQQQHHNHLQQPLTTTQYQHQFKQDQHHQNHHHHGRQFMQN